MDGQLTSKRPAVAFVWSLSEAISQGFSIPRSLDELLGLIRAFSSLERIIEVACGANIDFERRWLDKEGKGVVG